MNKPKKPTWKKAAIIGALVVHPVVGTVAFALGAVLGCRPYMPDGAPVAYGFDGAANGIGILLIIYMFSLGIAPLLLSAVGAAIGVGLHSFRKP
jgi:hypothetical protein